MKSPVVYEFLPSHTTRFDSGSWPYVVDDMRLIRVLCETKLLTTRGSHKRRVTLSVVDETRLMRVVCHDTDRGFSDTAGAKPKSSPSPPVSTKLSQLVSLDACRLESTNESSQTW